MKDKNPEDFEEAMLRLEEIVEKIENDEVKLDEALDKYQEGMKLIKFCQDKLKYVEQKIKIFDTESDSLEDLKVE